MQRSKWFLNWLIVYSKNLLLIFTPFFNALTLAAICESRSKCANFWKTPVFKLLTAANERNAEAEKDKTRLVSFFYRVKIENSLKSMKTVKELQLTDRKVSKSLILLSVTMLLPQECSRLQPVMWTQAVRPFYWKCSCPECVWHFLLHKLHFLLYVHLKDFSL